MPTIPAPTMATLASVSVRGTASPATALRGSAGRQRLPLVVVAPLGLLAGEGEGGYRLHGKTRREEPERVGRFIAGGRAPCGDPGPAVAPLATAHAGAGESLERPRLIGARRNALPKRSRRDRLAAADRDLVADEAGEVRRRGEERPEGMLKPPGAVPTPAGASPERLERGRKGAAEVARGGESGEGAFGKGRVRSAHASPVARHEDPGKGSLRLVVPDNLEASPAGVPAMLAAEEPRELGRGMEAVAHAHRVHVEGPLAPRFDVAVRVDPGEDGSPHPFVVVFDPDEDVPMEHRNAPACKGRAVADPPYDEFRRVAERGKHRPRPDNGRRRRLGHRHDFDPSRRKLARHLEVERPVAGDEHPRARGDPIGASQGLGCARRHDPGKGPAGNRMRPLVRPGGDDELTRADTARAAADEDLDFRRCRVRIVASAGPTDRVGAPHRGGADDLHPRGPHPLDEVGPGRELPIPRAVRGKAMARGELLEVLPARLVPLVEDGHGHAGPGGGFGCGKPGRTGPDDEEDPLRLRHPVRGGRDEGRHPVRRDGRPVVAMGGNRHSVPHPRHARPLPRAPVHRHQALVADPHAAEDAARAPVARPSKRGNPRRGEGCRHRLPLDRRNRPALEVDRDRRTLRDDSRRPQAKGIRGEVVHQVFLARRSTGPSGSREAGRRSSHAEATAPPLPPRC